MSDLTASLQELSEDQREQAEELIEALKDELGKQKPKHHVANAILSALKLISAVPKFLEAIEALQQFVAELPPAA